jgi:hypothetical protein
VGQPYILSENCVDFENLNAQFAATTLANTCGLLKSSASNPGAAAPASSIHRKGLDIIQSMASIKAWATKTQLTRSDFASALDLLAEEDGFSADYNTLSSFDREFSVVTNDIAPYVRIIASQDLAIERERASQLLSGQKRARMSRASRSALDGGRREQARRDRWFAKDLNLLKVMETGSSAWYGDEAGFVKPLGHVIAGSNSTRYLSDMQRC